MDSFEIYLQNYKDIEMLQDFLNSKISGAKLLQSKGAKTNFLDNINNIESLLNKYDPPSSPILQYIDKKSQDLSTYFLIAYLNTNNIKISMWIYHLIRLLIRYILLFDRFYEIGDKKYCQMAIETRKK